MPIPGFRPRTLAPYLSDVAARFPAVVVTGPRQSGKTTLVRTLFGETHRYCSLDDPAIRDLAASDPALLLSRFPPPVILDEVQYAPGILSAVKVDIDENRRKTGRYVLTGSQVFPLMQGVSESLAGRVAVLSLHSLSIGEVLGEPKGGVPWRSLIDAPAASLAPDPVSMAGFLIRGGFPTPALDVDVDVRAWHASYLATYLERDVRSLRSVGDLRDFHRLLVLLAARTGNLVNLEEIARDLGVTGKTVKAWVSVLEASGQILVLPPWFSNIGKRLVKRPKIHFLDSGVLAHLMGLSTPEQVLEGGFTGPFVESAMVGQIVRLLAHRGETPSLSFFRTSDGHEVDLVVEAARELIPMEAKATATPTPRHAASIEKFLDLVPGARRGLLVCLCRERLPLTRRVEAVPLADLG